MPDIKNIKKLNINRMMCIGCIIVFSLAYLVLVFGTNILKDKTALYNGVGDFSEVIDNSIRYYNWNWITYIGIWIFVVSAILMYFWRESEKRNLGYVFIGIFAFVPRLLQVGTMVFGDDVLYINCFEAANSMHAFNFYKHPTFSFSLIWDIGYLLFDNHIVGLQVVSAIMGAIASVLVYDAFMHEFPNVGLKKIILVSTMVFWAPINLGLSGCITPDYAVFVFCAFVWWAYVRKKPLFYFLFSLLLVFAKENGVIVYAGLGMGILLYDVISKKNMKFIARFKDKFLIESILIGVITIIYYLYEMFSPKASGLWFGDTGGTPTFYIDWKFVGLKLASITLIDFLWIVWGVLVVAIVVVLVKKRQISSRIVLPLVCSFLIDFIALAYYVTLNEARYSSALEVVLLMLTGYFILVLSDVFNGLIKCLYDCVLWCVAFLLLIQSFVTIDPIMKKVFMPSETGSFSMVYTTIDGGYCTVYDGRIYNHQYNHLNKIMDIVLSEVGYDENMDIVFADEVMYGGYNFIIGYENEIGWNKELGKRCLKDENTIDLSVVSLNGEAPKLKFFNELHSNAVLILWGDATWTEEEAINRLKTYYNIGQRHEVSIRGQGKAVFYEMDLILDR